MLKFYAMQISEPWQPPQPWTVTGTDYEDLTELEAKIIAAICNEAQEPGGVVFDTVEAHWAWQLMLKIEELETKLAK